MQTHRTNHSPAAQGFTLLDLTLSVAGIAILAAMIVPITLGTLERTRIAVARESLATLGKAMKQFHYDTHSWPYHDATWAGASDTVNQVTVGAFSSVDSAMYGVGSSHAPPTVAGNSSPLSRCESLAFGVSCWSGPYLQADTTFIDPWGHPYQYGYVSASSADNSTLPVGAIVVWSAGPDGIDQTGCSTSACSVSLDNLASGHSSLNGADDIVLYVGSAT